MSKCKFYKELEYVSYDGGETWSPTGVFRKGDLIERDSADCAEDYTAKYLTFVVKSGGTFTFNPSAIGTTASTLEYSLDSGSTWATLPHRTASPRLEPNSTIMWRMVWNDSTNISGIGYFSATAGFEVEGNPLSLVYGNNFASQTSLASYPKVLHSLFSDCTTLTNAENMVLPATTLSNDCYSFMFEGCTNLKKGVAVLPAMTLTEGCYDSMYMGCTSLLQATELPATATTAYCYSEMYERCTSLERAPELPATSLARYSCYEMFNGCTSLNYIKTSATDISGYQSHYNWLNGVASSGEFYCKAATDWPDGANGLPTGWTKITF